MFVSSQSITCYVNVSNKFKMWNSLRCLQTFILCVLSLCLSCFCLLSVCPYLWKHFSDDMTSLVFHNTETEKRIFYFGITSLLTYVDNFN